MTYKAGDKVVVNVDGKDEMLTYDRMHKDRYVFQEYPFFSFRPNQLRPATPVEIAKQAVLDEVNANGDIGLITNLIDQLISEVKISTLNITKETFEQALTNNLSETITPPIIGDETNLD